VRAGTHTDDERSPRGNQAAHGDEAERGDRFTRDDDARGSGAADEGSGGDRAVRRGEWRRLALLGLPSLVLALATTVVTTYLPVHLQAGKASTTMIGLLIGTEGLMALVVPLVAGAWSDRLRTPLGGRLPFLVGGAPVLAAALVLLGFVGSLGLAALLLVIFFAAYFACYEPYRALYPDLISDDIAARGQSTQALSRGVGTFLALAGGGLLIALADPTPFVTAAVIAAVALAAFVLTVHRQGIPEQDRPDAKGPAGVAHELWCMIRDRPALRYYLGANALWELSLGALKTFVVLYVTIGMGESVATASLIIGGVALLLLVASPVAGKLADRHGRLRVMQWALPVYGLALLVPFLITSKPIIAVAVPFIALGGGVVMTLPYALLMPLMKDQEHGALTGYYSFSRGVGTALGPLLAGVAISLCSGLFGATKGYQATWGVCAAAILLSLLPLRRLARCTDADA
jgi:MFS family permease